jgi:very-short-patch-repair endonuclease/DNA-binding CsgD family transcriptional regulator
METNLSNEKYKEFIKKEYLENNKSPYEIAAELGTYANKIKRDLLKLKIKLRDKSAAQSAALKTGRKKHPTEGIPRATSTKLKISKGVAESWESLSDEELKQRSDEARKRWEAIPAAERENMQRLAVAGLRVAAEQGSKIEHELWAGLIEAGFEIEHHKTDLLPDEKLHIDLYIPSLCTAIEIDGPTHFLPIWGDERLKKTMLSDAKKTGILVSKGINIIRVKLLSKTVSQNKTEELKKELIRLLSLETRKKIIEIEV